MTILNQNKMKIETQLTAVEWFAKQVLRSRQLGFISNEKFNEIFEQAKEMEKEQKIEFAKLHVYAALKAVEDKIIVKGYAGSIMNSYLLDNIK